MKPVIFSNVNYNTHRLRTHKKPTTNYCKISPNSIVFCALLLFCGLVLPYLYTISHDQGKSGNLETSQRSILPKVDMVSTKDEKGNSPLTSNTLDMPHMLRLRQDPQLTLSSTAAGRLQDVKRLAYVITITKDGPFLDGAAILAHSIVETSKSSPYVNSLIAFVHPNVTKSRPGLRKLGYHVIEVPIPINTSAIQFDFLREKINKNGCCGSAELLKISSYRLKQYHRVIHLDADTMILNSISELFERNYSLIYTTDPNMATYKGIDKMPVQGGFIVLQPSIDDYNNILNIVMTTEFRKGSGWNRTKIGWFWGGMTVQGVLPYYYNLITFPGRTQIVDRCFYNTMADVPECITPNKTLSVIKSAHFTVCQKPWNCEKGYVNNLCQKLHQRWYQIRELTEAFYGIPVNTKPCPRGGPQAYIPMQLENANFDYSKNLNFIPDDSPDRLDPLPVSRYISTKYD